MAILGTTRQYRVAFTLKLVRRAVKEATRENFRVLHFSSHGNEDGVFLTNSRFLRWREFVELVRPWSGEDKALVMATCNGGVRGLTKALEKAGVTFGWVFGSTAESVHFSDSCLAWSILYNRLYDHGFDRKQLKVTLKAINAAIEGDFVYRRWTGKAYRRYPAKA